MFICSHNANGSSYFITKLFVVLGFYRGIVSISQPNALFSTPSVFCVCVFILLSLNVEKSRIFLFKFEFFANRILNRVISCACQVIYGKCGDFLWFFRQISWFHQMFSATHLFWSVSSLNVYKTNFSGFSEIPNSNRYVTWDYCFGIMTAVYYFFL